MKLKKTYNYFTLLKEQEINTNINFTVFPKSDFRRMLRMSTMVFLVLCHTTHQRQPTLKTPSYPRHCLRSLSPILPRLFSRLACSPYCTYPKSCPLHWSQYQQDVDRKDGNFRGEESLKVYPVGPLSRLLVYSGGNNVNWFNVT